LNLILYLYINGKVVNLTIFYSSLELTGQGPSEGWVPGLNFLGYDLKIGSFSIMFLLLLHGINLISFVLFQYNKDFSLRSRVSDMVFASYDPMEGHYNTYRNSLWPRAPFGRKSREKGSASPSLRKNTEGWETSSFSYTDSTDRKSSYEIKDRKETTLLFSILLLSLQIILYIFFTVTDLVPFYVTFEASMIPLFNIIFIFGKRQERINAAYYLFFYTLIGSLSFLIGIGYLIINEGNSSLIALNFMTIIPNLQIKLFLLFFIPFAVKLPLVPFHLWLPEAHVEASTEGSVLLAALLLKISGYGIIKVLFNLLPLGSLYFKPIILTLGLLSVLLIAFSLFRQLDIKKIIAYTSILHMNLALLGLFTFNIEGFYGAYSLMIIHGFVSSGLFILIGFLYNRFHSRALFDYSGLDIYMPKWSLLFFLFTLANCSFPFTGAFIPEILLFLSLFKNSILIGFITLLGGFLIVIVSFLTYIRITKGTVSKKINGLLVLPDKPMAKGKDKSAFQPMAKGRVGAACKGRETSRPLAIGCFPSPKAGWEKTGPQRESFLHIERDLSKGEYELLCGLILFIGLTFFFPKIFFNIPELKVLALLYPFIY
jgi:proton-translocating NADH-quinone oxidoreductase chain M